MEQSADSLACTDINGEFAACCFIFFSKITLAIALIISFWIKLETPKKCFKLSYGAILAAKTLSVFAKQCSNFR